MQDYAAEMCAIGRRAYARELVDGTGGNFSVRRDDGHVLCTPTMMCKGRMTPDDLCVVDLEGRPVAGKRRASSEILMHLEIYAGSPRTRAVVHCHPPYATAQAVAGQPLPLGVLPEGDVFLGPVPLVAYQTPGTRAMGVALRPYVAEHVAALLQNHGTVTWAADLETAYVLTETLEAVCRVYQQAQLIGGARSIPAEGQAQLAELRRKLRGAS